MNKNNTGNTTNKTMPGTPCKMALYEEQVVQHKETKMYTRKNNTNIKIGVDLGCSGKVNRYYKTPAVLLVVGLRWKEE